MCDELEGQSVLGIGCGGLRAQPVCCQGCLPLCLLHLHLSLLLCLRELRHVAGKGSWLPHGMGSLCSDGGMSPTLPVSAPLGWAAPSPHQLCRGFCGPGVAP